jgi:hypothetical protein
VRELERSRTSAGVGLSPSESELLELFGWELLGFCFRRLGGPS